MRLFVALDLTEPAQAELAAWRDELIAGREGLRPVRAEFLHVTLAFLGSRPETDVDRIASTVLEAARGHPSPRLAPGAVQALPRHAPRLIALELRDPAGRAATLQAAVAGALERERLFKPEARPFWPHVTLARVKRGARLDPVAAEQPGLPARVETGAVTLYRSRPSPQGSIYEPLAAAELAGAPSLPEDAEGG